MPKRQDCSRLKVNGAVKKPAIRVPARDYRREWLSGVYFSPLNALREPPKPFAFGPERD